MRLDAMNRLLECTPYEGYKRVSTVDQATGEVFEHHNLVILSRYDIVEHDQYLHEYAPSPRYQKVTAQPEEREAREISWERPILHAKVQLPNNVVIDVINLHLKSRRPTNIQGHKLSERTWEDGFGLGGRRLYILYETHRPGSGDQDSHRQSVSTRTLVP